MLRAKNALGGLARDKADFDAISAFAPDAIDGVLACIEAARSGAPAMDGLEDVLRELAERGFAAIPKRTDPRAELVSVYNVGGVVLKSTFAPGVPRAAWGENRKVCAGGLESVHAAAARAHSLARPAPLGCARRGALRPARDRCAAQGPGAGSLFCPSGRVFLGALARIFIFAAGRSPPAHQSPQSRADFPAAPGARRVPGARGTVSAPYARRQPPLRLLGSQMRNEPRPGRAA